MNASFELALFVFLLAIAFAIVRERDLFAAAMLTSVFSLVSAGMFTFFDAVDVAFTEAAVGAGMSTVLVIAALSLTTTREARPAIRRRRWGSLLVVLLTGGALIYGTMDMPAYGAADAPIHAYLAPDYIAGTRQDIQLPNIVTAILASYRGFDTFGELAVIFTAGVGVTLLLAWRRSDDVPRLGVVSENFLQHRRVRDIPVLRTTTKLLVPLVMLFALYVQAHGDFGPGGGFQAGVIFASALVLFGLTYSPTALSRIVTARWVERIAAGGLLMYGAVGIVCIAKGGRFLEYGVLAHDAIHGQHWGIFLVELGVGLTVTAVMLTVYSRFALRGAE